MARISAIVPVRAGSKGLPDKNKRELCGLPLFEHAVRQGLRTADRCVVSTDMIELLDQLVDDDRIVHRRPAHLATDTATMDDALRDVIQSQSMQADTLVLLQATSPLRSDADILAAIDLFLTREFDLTMSVAATDSGVLKYGTLADDQFIPLREPAFCFANRAELPGVYRPNGAVYVFSAEWFLSNGGLATENIGASLMPMERSLDIDTLDDFLRVEQLFSSNHVTASPHG